MKEADISPAAGRGYIINLSRSRSILALIASLITVVFSIYAIVGGIVMYVRQGRDPGELFHWFTTISNTLTAFGAAMIIPFAVEGIRNKYFSYPKWVAMLHYSGIVCTTLTMALSLGIMSWSDPETAFGGYNTYLHVLCPIMVLLAFFMVESGIHYTIKDSCLTIIPTMIYVSVYIWQVIIIGPENGGWEDMYNALTLFPFPVPVLVLMLLSTVLVISLLIRWCYNKLTAVRARRLNDRLWPEDTNPVEINIEIFGLGRYMGAHADMKYIGLPLDLIKKIAERYDIKTESLLRPYIRGLLDSINDRQG